MRATTAKALRNRRSNSRVSLTLAAVAAQATGTPSPVVAMWYLVPRLPRSVGFRPVRSPPRLARTEQLSRIRSGSPRSIATSRACTRWSRLTAAQPASRRRRVEPLAWAGVAFRPRHGVPSRRNRRRVASTRTVSAGGCPGPGSPGPSHRSITVAIRSKILTSNIAPLPCRKARDGHRRGAQVIKPSQPGVDVETGSKASAAPRPRPPRPAAPARPGSRPGPRRTAGSAPPPAPPRRAGPRRPRPRGEPGAGRDQRAWSHRDGPSSRLRACHLVGVASLSTRATAVKGAGSDMSEAQVLDRTAGAVGDDRLRLLAAIERKLLWLSSWTIHHAHHLRPSRDKLKVGGHQASCASVASILTALYFDVLRPGDRVAVKPHASPIYHAAMHLLGRETIEQLANFRALGGAQSYPSRTKDKCGVDFSTGSVGLGAGMTLFASLTQDYVRLHGLTPPDLPEGRMISIVGDAELDEGNIYEALLEGWKYDVRNVWWVIDYNRQSLARVVPERLFAKIEQFFVTVGWRFVTIKYGKKLAAAFARPGGEVLRDWIDACPNDLYAALTFKGGAAWRAHLESDLGRHPTIRALLDGHDDGALAAL